MRKTPDKSRNTHKGTNKIIRKARPSQEGESHGEQPPPKPPGASGYNLGAGITKPQGQ